jgi:DNA-binding transcriptional MerR regulator
MFTIGAFSQIGQVSIKALRFYDEIGLLKPSYVDRESGYRYYAATLLPRLNHILVLKQLGFSLEEIAELLRGDLSVRQVSGMLLRQRKVLEQKVKQEQARLTRVESWIALLEREARIPGFEISLKRVPPQWVASLRRSLGGYDETHELFDELEGHLQRHGAGGQRGAVWHACAGRKQAIDCEALLFLRAPVPGNDHVRVYELPAATVACIVDEGSDESCAQAYSAARSWVKSQGHVLAGPNREVYWHNSGSDSNASITEIQFPIAVKPMAGVRRAAR